MYLSMHLGMGCGQGGVCGQWWVDKEVCVDRENLHSPETATDAVGTYPNGIHTCKKDPFLVWGYHILQPSSLS